MPFARSPTWRRLVVALLANAFLFFALEAGLRLSGRTFDPAPLNLVPVHAGIHKLAQQGESILRLHPELFWELRPGGVDPWGWDSPNELTFRGPAISLEKPDSTFRIALIGDSCTYGMHLVYEQAYGTRLEEFLSVLYPDRRIEVINAGVPGYSLHQACLALQEKVLPFEPDAVVFYSLWNDSAPARGSTDSARARAELPGASGAFLGRFAFYRMLRSWVQIDPTDDEALVEAWIAGEPAFGYRVSPDEYEALLDEALSLCESRGIQPIVIVPDLNWRFIDTWAEEHREQRREVTGLYRERADRVARRRGAASVDMRALFEGRDDSETFLPRDPVHPDANGYLLLAGALAEVIRDHGWVERIEPGAGAPGRPLRSRAFSLPGGGRVSLEIDGGRERAGEAYLVLPSLRALQKQTPEASVPLDPNPFLRALRSNPARAQEMGYLGRLDDTGHAVAEVTVPSGIAPGRMLGFAFATARDGPGALAVESGFSNDVWVRIENPVPVPASFADGSAARALPGPPRR